METFGEKISAEACSGKEIEGLKKMMCSFNSGPLHPCEQVKYEHNIT